jgi:hypothetical protein
MGSAKRPRSGYAKSSMLSKGTGESEPVPGVDVFERWAVYKHCKSAAKCWQWEKVNGGEGVAGAK